MVKSFNAKTSAKIKSSVTSKQPISVVKECTIEFFYYDKIAEEDVEGEVKFDDNRIVVSYGLDDGSYVVYQGIENGKGHYELRAPAVNGKATPAHV